jgi:hypothetical protein
MRHVVTSFGICQSSSLVYFEWRDTSHPGSCRPCHPSSSSSIDEKSLSLQELPSETGIRGFKPLQCKSSKLMGGFSLEMDDRMTCCLRGLIHAGPPLLAGHGQLCRPGSGYSRGLLPLSLSPGPTPGRWRSSPSPGTNKVSPARGTAWTRSPVRRCSTNEEGRKQHKRGRPEVGTPNNLDANP